MRVLITGGYGFIGSSVAERFYKEGHKIYILDDLSTGRKENISFNHKAWILDIADSKCEEIFKANQFDVVIHLAAQVEVGKSFEDPVQDAKQNIIGLMNMLELSSKYNVSKFLFASSAAVYADHCQQPIPEEAPLSPQSPYGLNKLAGEYYTEKWNELFGLDTLVLRFSNVYGPGQSAKGESGVISCFLNNIMKDEPLTVYGDGTQTRDFIYVSDVAEAIYRSVLSNIKGIFNLSSKTKTSVNELIATIQTFTDIKEVNYLAPKQGDIKDSCLDHSKLTEEIDWMPKYTIEMGMKNTFDWHRERKEESDPRSDQVSSRLFLSLKRSQYFPFFENLFLFVLFASLSQLLGQTVTPINPMLVYIFIIGMLLGKNQAFIAVLLASIHLISMNLSNGRELVSIFTDYGLLFQFAILLLVGLVSGYVIDRRRIREEALQDDLDELKEKYEFLESIHHDTKQNQVRLQQQIFQTEDSVGKVFEVISSLDSLESVEVISGAVKAVEKLMNVDKVALYHVNESQQFLRLAGKSGGKGFEVPRSISVMNHPLYKELISKKKVIMNHEWENEALVMAAPVISGEKVIAVIELHEPRFDSLTLHYENLFTVISRLISSALSRGYEYETATYSQRYISGSRILKPDVFKKLIQKREKMKEEMNIPFSLLVIPWVPELKQLIEKISSQLRDTDFLGSDEEGKLFILLSNSTKMEVDIVVDRLKRQEIEVEKVNGKGMHQHV